MHSISDTLKIHRIIDRSYADRLASLYELFPSLYAPETSQSMPPIESPRPMSILLPSDKLSLEDQSSFDAPDLNTPDIDAEDAATETDQESLDTVYTDPSANEVSRKLIMDEEEKIKKSMEKFVKSSRNLGYVSNLIHEEFHWDKETETDSDLLKWLTRYYAKYKIAF